MSEQDPTSVPVVEQPSSSSGKTPKNVSPTRAARKTSTVDSDTTPKHNASASPTRPSNGPLSTPSAAAVQRALSATRAASAANDSSSDTTRDRSQRSGRTTPQWPTSPRLKSPPPAGSLRSIPIRKIENEQNQSNTAMRRLAPVSNVEMGAMTQVPQDLAKESSVAQPILRPPGRGVSAQGSGLETVAENSVPTTPSMAPVRSQEENSKLQIPGLESNLNATGEQAKSKDSATQPSNETAPKLVLDKAETAPPSRAASASRPAANLAKRSITSLTGKQKPATEPLRTITLETETVSSTPQLITDRGRDGGSVRTKPSTETIRPKKEKKKPPRKTPSLHAGTNSSKADIFEAKVASAVDEADSSDSDETFVYESNPPEPRPGRHHSRTPSANSLASQMDQYGTRGKYGMRSNSTVVGGKKSMKFSNSLYNSQLDAESAGDGRGSTRTTNSTARHHHISRHGRNGHASVMDNDSPFTSANRAHSPRTPTTHNSRPNSPRTSNGRLHSPRKSATAGYDAYDDGADDERAPLMGSVRRNRHSRRPNSGQYRVMQFTEDEEPGCWPKHSCCLAFGLMVTIICIGVAIFVFLLNKPLMDIEVTRIQNVLASEQELMLDLRVRATNPNLFTITVNDLNIDVFAESPYVGSSAEWERTHSRRSRPSIAERRQENAVPGRRIPFWFPPWGPGKGVDDGTDPIDDPDPEPGTQKMLLGRIYHFDSPLSFDPSPLRHNPSESEGAIRLAQPGNLTERGGSARWERVLQHSFDLIVRGVIHYQLPLSSSTKSAKVASRITVSPNGDSDEGDEGDEGDVTFPWLPGHSFSKR